MAYLLRVSQIPEAGIGCFTTASVSEGQQVAPDITENFRLLKEHEILRAHLKYCILRSDGLYLAPEHFLRMNVFWYINHAREPNLSFVDKRLTALRTLAPNEELTLYYSDLLTHPVNKTWVKSHHIRNAPDE